MNAQKTGTSDLHRCPTCNSRHRPAKAHRAMSVLAWCTLLAAIQVVAALHLDGWLAIALWCAVARNVFIFVSVVYGLAILATNPEATR